jgi:hypothetical protein
MKESCNWYASSREDKARPALKRFSYPYPDIMGSKSPTSTPVHNKRQFTLMDKENYRNAYEKPDRKKTISPERKKPPANKRKQKKAGQNIVGFLNKTEELRRSIQQKPQRVKACGSHGDFVKGKSAESKRQRRL